MYGEELSMIIFVPLGLITAVFQLIVLREFCFSIAKHELAFVLAAGCWIIACACGSLINPPKRQMQLWSLPLSAAAYSVTVILIHLIKSLNKIQYFQVPGPLTIGLALILVGLPALTMGVILRWLLQNETESPLGRLAAWPARFLAFEALGFFLGGIIFTFWLKDYTNPLTFSWLPLLLLPAIQERRLRILSICAIALITFISSANYNNVIKCEFDQAQILINRGSRYGPVILAVKSKVKNLFSGGSLLATSEDKAATEEFINSSLLAASVQTEKDILFIGTAVSGQIEEISQYRLSSLDCLQINPLLWQFVPSFSTHRLDKRMRFITGDPRSYLKTTAKRYDAILMNMPAPATLALNRYFTLEFFQLVGRCLKPDGIFSFSIPSKREILSPQFAKFNSSIINSLEKVFPKKLIIPSDTMIIIASLKKDIAAQDLIDNFSIIKPPTEFLTIYHLRDNLEPRIRDYVQSRLDKNIAPNLDLYPSGFLHYLALEQLKFYPRLNLNLENIRKCIIILLILGGLGIILCVHMPKIMALINIGAIGFTSISLSSILFIIFQLYGAALFWKLGLLIAFFMAGTAAGTWVVGKIKNLRPAFLVWVYLSWMAAALLLLAGLKRLNTINDASLILYCLALSCGMLTGSSYPLQAKNLTKNGLVNRKVPGIIYAADLGGAFLGALASGIFLIPFLGIPESLFALALLNAIMALVNLRR